VSYIHELITIIMAKREPNGVERSRRNILPSPTMLLSNASGRISRAAVLDLDRPSVAVMAVEEFSQVFRLHSCFCKITVRDLQAYVPKPAGPRQQCVDCEMPKIGMNSVVNVTTFPSGIISAATIVKDRTQWLYVLAFAL
jgi:hypothetical protein